MALESMRDKVLMGIIMVVNCPLIFLREKENDTPFMVDEIQGVKRNGSLCETPRDGLSNRV